MLWNYGINDPSEFSSDECCQTAKELVGRLREPLDARGIRSDIAELHELSEELNILADSRTIAEPKTLLQTAKTHGSLTIMLKRTGIFGPFLETILTRFNAFNERFQPDLDSPLHYATRNFDVTFFQWLQNQESLDINIRNKAQKTALFMLCEQYNSVRRKVGKCTESGQQTKTLQACLNKMDKDRQLINDESLLVNTLNRMKNLSDDNADKAKLLACVQWLAADGRIYQSRGDSNGNTALHVALKAGLVDVAKLLLSKSKFLYLGAQNNKEQHAELKQKEQLNFADGNAKLLSNSKQPPNAKNGIEMIPLLSVSDVDTNIEDNKPTRDGWQCIPRIPGLSAFVATLEETILKELLAIHDRNQQDPSYKQPKHKPEMVTMQQGEQGNKPRPVGQARAQGRGFGG
ncbi:hypothetical protein RP20_CCG014890 [Aedes albopictus]|nr:hypothetical protein RP20_CCG014890 [Aedes albopictus]